MQHPPWFRLRSACVNLPVELQASAFGLHIDLNL